MSVAEAEHAGVQPVARERRDASIALALRDLVLVVREDQVRPATVNIHLRAEDGCRHRRALDMPARSPASPGTLPPRLARLGSLPEGEVARIMLALVRLDARASQHRLLVAAREFAIA